MLFRYTKHNEGCIWEKTSIGRFMLKLVCGTCRKKKPIRIGNLLSLRIIGVTHVASARQCSIVRGQTLFIMDLSYFIKYITSIIKQ